VAQIERRVLWRNSRFRRRMLMFGRCGLFSVMRFGLRDRAETQRDQRCCI
jgi:hypothetical protein